MSSKRFSPRLIPTIGAIVFVVLFFSLGQWQLQRAEQKRQLQQQWQQQSLAPVNIDTASINIADLRWRQVLVSGYFEEQQLLLDNQMMAGKPGYHVFTPFRLLHDDSIILVNRGWVPAGIDRRQPPSVLVPKQQVQLQGIIKPYPFSGIRLKPTITIESMTTTLSRVHSLQREDLEAHLGIPLSEQVLRLSPVSVAGFARNWNKLTPEISPSRNMAYAWQWFAMMITVVIVYLALGFRRPSSDAQP